MDDFINSTIHPQFSIDLRWTTNNELLNHVLKYMSMSQYFKISSMLKFDKCKIDNYLQNHTTINIYEHYVKSNNIYKCVGNKYYIVNCECCEYTDKGIPSYYSDQIINQNGKKFIIVRSCPKHGYLATNHFGTIGFIGTLIGTHPSTKQRNIFVALSTIPIITVILLEQNINTVKYILDLYISSFTSTQMKALLFSILHYPSHTTEIIINTIISYRIDDVINMMNCTYQQYRQNYRIYETYTYIPGPFHKYILEEYVVPRLYKQLLDHPSIKLNIERFDNVEKYRRSSQDIRTKNLKEFYTRFNKRELILYVLAKRKNYKFIIQELDMPLLSIIPPYIITMENKCKVSSEHMYKIIEFMNNVYCSINKID